MKNVEDFLCFVLQKNAFPLSLHLSSKVIQSRELISVSTETALLKIKQGFKKLDSLYNICEQIQKNKKIMNDNSSFAYSESMVQYKKLNLGNFYPLCEHCQVTCCQICVWSRSSYTSASPCYHFDSYNRCHNCSCPKSSHIRADSVVIKEQVTVNREYSFMKKDYQEGVNAVVKELMLMKSLTQQN